jgi:beta-N-acetylhexosaminidase
MGELRAFISGCEGSALSDAERAFFGSAKPCGLILFKRNCHSPSQVRALVSAFHEAIGEPGALVLVDQEGGRVQRLGPPHWPAYPPAAHIARTFARTPQLAIEAARLCGRLLAHDLHGLGITVNCAPVLDVPVAGAHQIIGDRAFGNLPDQVSTLGRALAEGLLAGGVLPVIKHLPGHGRATADSHFSLPVIGAPLEALRAHDFRPFAALRDMPLGMTAHVLMPAIDGQRPASLSEAVITQVIRGEIGFDGLLMCDDLNMKALRGPLDTLASDVLRAGCDVILHCNGRLRDMEHVAGAAPRLTGPALERFERARVSLKSPEPLDEAAARARFAQLLAVAA